MSKLNEEGLTARCILLKSRWVRLWPRLLAWNCLCCQLGLQQHQGARWETRREMMRANIYGWDGSIHALHIKASVGLCCELLSVGRALPFERPATVQYPARSPPKRSVFAHCSAGHRRGASPQPHKRAHRQGASPAAFDRYSTQRLQLLRMLAYRPR